MRRSNAIATVFILLVLLIGGVLIWLGIKEMTPLSVDEETEPETIHVEYNLAGYLENGCSNLFQHYLDSEAGDHVIARMYIPDTAMETPIVDSEYYFRRNIDGKYDTAGTPLALTTDHFMKPGHNAIIYGHRLDSKENFGMLQDYLDQSFYDEHPDIMIETTSGTTSWRIISVFALNYQTDNFDYTKCENLTAEGDRSYFLSQIKNHNAINTGKYVSSADDEYITLSTCHYEVDPENGRLVVVAVRK